MYIKSCTTNERCAERTSFFLQCNAMENWFLCLVCPTVCRSISNSVQPYDTLYHPFWARWLIFFFFASVHQFCVTLFSLQNRTKRYKQVIRNFFQFARRESIVWNVRIEFICLSLWLFPPDNCAYAAEMPYSFNWVNSSLYMAIIQCSLVYVLYDSARNIMIHSIFWCIRIQSRLFETKTNWNCTHAFL